MARMLLNLIALAAAGAATAQESLRPDVLVAFVGAMLADGYEAAPVHDAAVVIDGNRIIAAAARQDVEIPADAEVIELGGKERLDEAMPIAARQLIRAGVTSAVDLGTPFDILELREAIRAGRMAYASMPTSTIRA